MANLYSIAELAFNQLFPKPGDETAITREEFVATAKSEYALQFQLYYWREKREEGYFFFPGHLLTEVELDVVNNEIDISELNIFSGLSCDVWLQNIGGLECKCKYVKSDVNLSQLLCDDDSLGDDVKTYYPLGKRIKFPKGTHAKKLKIIYANRGDETEDEQDVDEALAGIVRTRLIEIYAGKTNPVDVTNNSNPNT